MSKAKKVIIAALFLAATGMGFVWTGAQGANTNLKLTGTQLKNGSVTFTFPPPSGDGNPTPTPTGG